MDSCKRYSELEWLTIQRDAMQKEQDIKISLLFDPKSINEVLGKTKASEKKAESESSQKKGAGRAEWQRQHRHSTGNLGSAPVDDGPGAQADARQHKGQRPAENPRQEAARAPAPVRSIAPVPDMPQMRSPQRASSEYSEYVEPRLKRTNLTDPLATTDALEAPMARTVRADASMAASRSRGGRTLADASMRNTGRGMFAGSTILFGSDRMKQATLRGTSSSPDLSSPVGAANAYHWYIQPKKEKFNGCNREGSWSMSG